MSLDANPSHLGSQSLPIPPIPPIPSILQLQGHEFWQQAMWAWTWAHPQPSFQMRTPQCYNYKDMNSDNSLGELGHGSIPSQAFRWECSPGSNLHCSLAENSAVLCLDSWPTEAVTWQTGVTFYRWTCGNFLCKLKTHTFGLRCSQWQWTYCDSRNHMDIVDLLFYEFNFITSFNLFSK